MNLYQEHLVDLLSKARKLLEIHKFSALLLGSGPQGFFYNDDHPLPWKMPATLRHFICSDLGPHAVLLITQSKTSVFLYQPKDYWYAPPKTPDGEWTHLLDIKIFDDLNKLIITLKLAKPDNAVWVGPVDPDLCTNCTLNPEPFVRALNELRVQKTPYEIEQIKQANQIALKGHNAAKTAFSEGKSELQIHLAYLEAIGVADEHLPYHNIVALNQHSAILHYQYFDAIAPTPLLSCLIDAGYSLNGYAADITRSYAAPHVLPEFNLLLHSLRALKLKLISSYHIGVSHIKIQEIAHHLIAELLIKVGILQGVDVEKAYKFGLTKIFFPHGIGHLLGLQVHDVGGFQGEELNPLGKCKEHPSLRLVRPLQENMVITVEPGIYFIPSLLDNVTLEQDKYLNYPLIKQLTPYGGVRDEDNIVIQKDEPLNLSRHH